MRSSSADPPKGSLIQLQADPGPRYEIGSSGWKNDMRSFHEDFSKKHPRPASTTSMATPNILTPPGVSSQNKYRFLSKKAKVLVPLYRAKTGLIMAGFHRIAASPKGINKSPLPYQKFTPKPIPFQTNDLIYHFA